LLIPKPTSFPSFFICYSLHQAWILATYAKQCSQNETQYRKVNIGYPKRLQQKHATLGILWLNVQVILPLFYFSLTNCDCSLIMTK
jgi:hypothetical protein